MLSNDIYSPREIAKDNPYIPKSGAEIFASLKQNELTRDVLICSKDNKNAFCNLLLSRGSSMQ